MDIVTLGAALNGFAEYVNSHFKGGSNIQIVNNPDGTQTINASGEVSSEDTVARAEIAAIKDGETLDSFGDVESALGNKADKSTTYTKTEVDTALSSKQNTISDLSTIRSGAALGATAVQQVSGKGLSTNDYTNDEKSKLAGIEAQANKTTVDSTLSGTSTNPVQNKVVKSALDGKQATLTTAQLAAVNSGITSTDVEQIETNKNNILWNTQNGVKNLSPWIGGTASADNTYIVTNEPISLPAGTYLVSYLTTADSGRAEVLFRNDGASVGSVTLNHQSGRVSGTVVLTSAATKFQIYTMRACTISEFMISPSTMDTSYQPYALSNAELTALVLKLQAALIRLMI